MRTTIDLPDDLHRIARAIANDSRRSLSDTIAILLRKALDAGQPATIDTDSLTGMPVVRLGRVITTDDVRAVDDEA